MLLLCSAPLQIVAGPLGCCSWAADDPADEIDSVVDLLLVLLLLLLLLISIILLLLILLLLFLLLLLLAQRKGQVFLGFLIFGLELQGFYVGLDAFVIFLVLIVGIAQVIPGF